MVHQSPGLWIWPVTLVPVSYKKPLRSFRSNYLPFGVYSVLAELDLSDVSESYSIEPHMLLHPHESPPDCTLFLL